MAIDANTNLLPDLFPHTAGGKEPARHFELLEILLHQFGSARSDQGSREMLFPDSDTPAMRARFNRDGQLIALYGMPGLTEATLAAIRERIRVELADTTGTGVGRMIFFSLAPVQGWWRYHDYFQILPVPLHAPRPEAGYAHYPFLLEFSYNRAGSSTTDFTRRCREAWPIHLVLNALLTMPIWWDGGQTMGIHRYS